MNINNELLSFIEKSPSVFHCIDAIKKDLLKNGYIELQESKAFNLESNGKYFITRNMSSIIAFNLPNSYDDYHFKIVASHSDSPTFKVKPIANLKTDKYQKLSVEAYGGMLCSTWFDRPLSFAGRVFVKNNENIECKLINIEKNILTIPSVAIHLNRQANENATYNLNIDMQPMFNQLEAHPFNDLLAKTLEVDTNSILSYDLFLYNRQPSYIWGLNDEFISSPKLDDLQCAFTSLKAFINNSNDKDINVYACFDNEEVGSSTRQGANSTFLYDLLSRINDELKLSDEKFHRALANSFLISADNSHAVHPNHPELSDGLNKVYLNQGVVIKYNAAQSYTSDGLSSAIFKNICKLSKVNYQEYTNRADLKGGSTLGNIATRSVSIMSIDIGLAQLAMHSSFETAGALDTIAMIEVLKAFYNRRITIDEKQNITIS